MFGPRASVSLRRPPPPSPEALFYAALIAAGRGVVSRLDPFGLLDDAAPVSIIQFMVPYQPADL